MKQKNPAGKSQSLRKLSFGGSFWGMVGLLCFSSGILLAGLMSLSPLRNQATSSRLPHSPNNVAGIIPATLDRPVNILVLGIDNSGHPHQGKFTPVEALSGNSDTMLLVRLVPSTHEINVLSIPRDTLVHSLGVEADKVNDANVRGGAKLAATTVSQLLENIPIDRYLRVDTEGFINLVDALGGLEINIPKSMNYTDKTQHLSIQFSPGRQLLNGKHLQEYVRFRHDALGDIGRVQRQQLVLKEILHKLLTPGTITKLPQVIQVVKDNVDTDLSVGEILAVGQTLANSDRQKLHLVMLPGRFSRKEEYRLSYWIYDPQSTGRILNHYFRTSPVAENPNSAQNPPAIKISLVNATKDEQVTANIISLLQKRGFKNLTAINSPIGVATVSPENTPEKTQIIAQHGNPEAANAVSSALGTGEIQVASVGDISSDVTVVIGKDLVSKLP